MESVNPHNATNVKRATTNRVRSAAQSIAIVVFREERGMICPYDQVLLMERNPALILAPTFLQELRSAVHGTVPLKERRSHSSSAQGRTHRLGGQGGGWPPGWKLDEDFYT